MGTGSEALVVGWTEKWRCLEHVGESEWLRGKRQTMDAMAHGISSVYWGSF